LRLALLCFPRRAVGGKKEGAQRHAEPTMLDGVPVAWLSAALAIAHSFSPIRKTCRI
jgi:hypothetical protein